MGGESTPTTNPHSSPSPQPESPSQRHWLHRLRWWIPGLLFLLVLVFEAGPSRWIYEGFGATAHLIAEVALYGTIGPILAFITLNFVDRWMEERETSELQARILAEARALSAANQQLSDDVLQGLFAVSILLAAIHSTALAPETAQRLQEAEQTLDHSIRRLREHLLDHPASR